MCGRYWVPSEEEDQEIRRIIREIAHPADQPVPTGLIVPTLPAPALTRSGPRLMRFGWKPSWMKTMLINARSETIIDKPLFGKPFEQGRRCLLPAGSFYEPSPDKKGRRFRPTDGGLLYMAGLYDTEEEANFVIITQQADDVVSASHPRMPLILSSEEMRDAWLKSDELSKFLLQGEYSSPIEMV